MESERKPKYRLLFVNDDPFLLFTYSEQLKEDFIVEKAENGMQAVQMVCSQSQNYYDVIVLDINMPIMDGFEASKRIADHLKSSKIFDFSESKEGHLDKMQGLSLMQNAKLDLQSA